MKATTRRKRAILRERRADHRFLRPTFPGGASPWEFLRDVRLSDADDADDAPIMRLVTGYEAYLLRQMFPEGL